MLDEQEFAAAERLYRQMFELLKSGHTRDVSAASLLDWYKELTGFDESEPNAIMHHRSSLYGPPCGYCGKPYRTPSAMLCAACGTKRYRHDQ